jgi:hypothetical protein
LINYNLDPAWIILNSKVCYEILEIVLLYIHLFLAICQSKVYFLSTTILPVHVDWSSSHRSRAELVILCYTHKTECGGRIHVGEFAQSNAHCRVVLIQIDNLIDWHRHCILKLNYGKLIRNICLSLFNTYFSTIKKTKKLWIYNTHTHTQNSKSCTKIQLGCAQL